MAELILTVLIALYQDVLTLLPTTMIQVQMLMTEVVKLVVMEYKMEMKKVLTVVDLIQTVCHVRQAVHTR